MANADGTIQVTFNGEIYNFPSLRDDLAKRGYSFRSRTDTEVLVYLYEEMGDKMVEFLDGDFGFGLWDDRLKRLLLARDQAGVKPVYYTEADGQFLFASEIKALLQHPAVRREVDEKALYDYLTYLIVPPPKTLFRHIYKLPAAGMLTLDLGQEHPEPKLRKYWEPLPGQIDIDHSDLDAQFEELFQRSVAKRLMSDVPVGVLFSGGVDSTLNTVFFQRMISPKRVKSFQVGMAGTTLYNDESPWAHAMAAQLGTEHHVIQITEQDLLTTAHNLVQHQDEPLSDPVCVPLYFVTKLAREAGMTVLHAGEGADELFCGYDNYRRFLHYHERFWKPLNKVPALVSWLGFHLLHGTRTRQWGKVAAILRRRALGQEFFMSGATAYDEYGKAAILAPEFRQRHADYDSFEIVAPLYRRMETCYPEATLLQKITFIELQLRLPELLLMRADKMAMANSIEVRVPFLDRDVINFALSVPEAYKLRNGVSKEPVKRLASHFVRREAVYRPKSGFGAPIQEWFRSQLGEHMHSLLAEDNVELEGYFDLATLKCNLQMGPATVHQAFQLWVIYNFLLWHRVFIASSDVAVS
jgi:asparagine synthase (glutamine-hydrolysing)